MFRPVFKAVRIKTIFPVAVILFLVFGLVSNPADSIAAAKAGLRLCADILIPSLFPFFVFSGLLISLGFAEALKRPMSHIMRPLFGVSGSGALALALGMISGYPLGAACVCDLYEGGSINRREAERLLAFCNNSGPLFIMGSVGAAMYGSREAGILLYTTHILAAVTVGVIFRCYKGNRQFIQKSVSAAPLPGLSFGEMLGNVIRKAVNNMLLICGFAIAFSVVIGAVVPSAAGGAAGGIAAGILEITTGLFRTASSAIPLAHKLTASAFIIGFAGFSVHFQVIGLVAKTDLCLRPYILGKALQGLIGALYMWAVMSFLVPAMPAWAPLPQTGAMPEALVFSHGVNTLVLLIFAASCAAVCVSGRKGTPQHRR